MAHKAGHWTENSVQDFLHKIAADFISQLEERMGSANIKQSDLARALDVTEGRVSQILNNPGNLTLSMIIKCARALALKVTVVAYDDGDAVNERGPINPDVFRICWERAGKPADFWALEEESATKSTAATVADRERVVVASRSTTGVVYPPRLLSFLGRGSTDTSETYVFSFAGGYQ